MGKFFAREPATYINGSKLGGHESLIIPGCTSLKENEFDAVNADHRAIRMHAPEDADYLGLKILAWFRKNMEPRL